MVFEDFASNISQFEELLQKITASMTTGLVFEKLPPVELWKRSEADVTGLQSLAGHLRELMLTLKPEKAPTIRRRTQALLQPLNSFRETLFRRSDDPLASSKLAIEELRKAVVEGSNLLELAKEIHEKPSESISAVLRLKEVYDSKEYLSAIPVPEATYARFAGLRKNIENLKLSVASLERALEELRKSLDSVSEEISRYRPSRMEEPSAKRAEAEMSAREEASSEPSLVSED